MANTKITTGADATIVAAATRAGLAAAPPDYSGTFEDVSRVYGETVKASGEMWGEIAKATALIGGELAKNAAEWNSAVQKIYDAGGTENVVNEIYALKDELRDLGPLSGVFGNRETRKKRMEILTRKNKLFSEIDKWGEALDNAAVAVESNNLDYNLMGLEKEETLNAIIASNTNNKITVAGHYARITKDDNGGLSYTIYNEDGSEATYSDGTTRTISLRDFQSLLTENVVDKENIYGNAMNELSTTAENLGATQGGEYTDYHSGKMRNALNNMTNTANDRRRLMRTAFGIDNKSFFEHITEGEENVETAGLWALMMKDLAAGEVKGELAVTTGQRGKLLANIKDTDNSGGISQEEINNQWMAFTGSLLSGESDFSKQAIIDYADKKFKTNFDFGARQKALGKNAGKGDSDDSGIPSFSGKGKGVQLLNSEYLDPNVATTLYTDIQNGNSFDAKDPITKQINRYSYNIVDGEGGWYQNYQKGDTPKTKESYIGPNGSDVARVFTNDNRFLKIETEYQKTVDLKGDSTEVGYEEKRIQKTPGEFNYGDEFHEGTGIDINYMALDDGDLAEKLNAQIPPQGVNNPNGYYFYAPPIAGVFQDYIILRDGNDNRVGDFIIKTDQGLDGNKDSLAVLISKLKEYGLLDNFKQLPKPGEQGYINTPESTSATTPIDNEGI